MKYTYILYTVIISLFFFSCSLNEDAGLVEKETIVTGFDGTFVQEDRVGRPAINTALINGARKEVFNTTLTKDLNSRFKTEIENELKKISPTFNSNTDVNALGLTANALADLLANDVLGVSLTGKTTFFDGTNALTGRTLNDDVMDVELLLIFGGSDGTQNPTLTTDFVDSNDKDFNNVFPYLPTPW